MRPLLGAILVFLAAVSRGGDELNDFTLEDTAGKKHTLSAHKDAKAVVLFFIDTQCPNVAKYRLRMIDLHQAFADKGVVFYAINSNLEDSPEAIARHTKASEYPFPVLLDREQKVADDLKIRTIPESIVVDSTRTVRYRGAFDDNKTEGLAKHRYVRDAVEAILSGKEVATPATTPVGCVLARPTRESKDATITWSSHIGSIIYASCTSCHRPGQIGPFTLTSYEQAKRWAVNIKAVTQARTMPPWKPVNHGFFQHERSLSDEQIDQIAKWVDAGAPQGDPSKAPPVPKFAEGWPLGEPDLVLEASGEYDVPAKGDDDYRCFTLDPKLTEDRYVTLVQFQPGNARIVHHVMTYVAAKGVRLKESENGKLGFSSSGTGPGFMPLGDLGGWAPGNLPQPLAEGTGYYLPKGSRIVMECHYHPSGRPEKDRTRIGLHFAKGKIKKRVRSQVVLNMGFEIPPGEKRFKVTASWKSKEDLHFVAIIPHMHLIGREIEVSATLPDKSKVTLVHIKDWDFNWQETYHFKEPVAIPAGTKVEVISYFDNSAENPNNPNNPPRSVGFGEQTTDEMIVAYIAYTRDQEK